MRKNILFDLDGTLLPMDQDKFMELYFKSMSVDFHGVIDPKTLVSSILECVKYVTINNDERTNFDMFMDHMDTLIDPNIQDIIPKWDEFYDGLFMNCKASTYVSKDMVEAIKILKKKGYNLIVATNPVLPLKSNHHRIKWAGLNPDDFSYISNLEHNHFCKPVLNFYEEVLRDNGLEANDCYMVGNDVEEDLVSRKLGLETYLITDCMINRNNLIPNTDHQGEYKDFLEFVKQLPEVL